MQPEIMNTRVISTRGFVAFLILRSHSEYLPREIFLPGVLGSFKSPQFPGFLAHWVKLLTSSGHDVGVREFEPCVGLCADNSEPGACFGFCVSLSLSLPCSCSVSLTLSKINKH